MPPTTAAPEAAPASAPRQQFEARFRKLPQDAREHAAGTAVDPDLSALCFDPAPAVIRSVLDNPRAGLVHARLIAANHRHPTGLQAVAGHFAFAQDREVQRLLLRNVQTPDSVVKSLFSSRQLGDLYRFSRSHDYPERHRDTVRASLKRRFSTATAEEKVDLLIATEGRMLAVLPGVPLDGRTVTLLCQRSLLPLLLIENLARWPATPPKLVAHLLKQPLVRQSHGLKQSLLRHPNCREG